MTIVEDLNKDRFINCNLRSIWKLLFCEDEAIKLTQCCVCFINPINFLLSIFRQPWITPRLFNVSTCCSVFGLLTQCTALGFSRDLIPCYSSATFQIDPTQLKTDQVHVEGPVQMQAALTKSKRLILHPPPAMIHLQTQLWLAYPFHVDYEEKWWPYTVVLMKLEWRNLILLFTKCKTQTLCRKYLTKLFYRIFQQAKKCSLH